MISEYMTHLPEEIDSSQTLDVAIQVMREKGIRHLPVMDRTAVVGVLSDRDVKFAMALLGHNGGDTRVKDVCSEDIYVVSPTASVKEVATIMLERKLGSVLVKDGQYLVGIFTTSDALRSLINICS
jgi:acetoin utilization protein AcuB